MCLTIRSNPRSYLTIHSQPTMSFAQMMEQTTDSDNSYEEELGNAKSELNALIDEISEVRSGVIICLPSGWPHRNSWSLTLSLPFIYCHRWKSIHKYNTSTSQARQTLTFIPSLSISMTMPTAQPLCTSMESVIESNSSKEEFSHRQTGHRKRALSPSSQTQWRRNDQNRRNAS